MTPDEFEQQYSEYASAAASLGFAPMLRDEFRHKIGYNPWGEAELRQRKRSLDGAWVDTALNIYAKTYWLVLPIVAFFVLATFVPPGSSGLQNLGYALAIGFIALAVCVGSYRLMALRYKRKTSRENFSDTDLAVGVGIYLILLFLVVTFGSLIWRMTDYHEDVIELENAVNAVFETSPNCTLHSFSHNRDQGTNGSLVYYLDNDRLIQKTVRTNDYPLSLSQDYFGDLDAKSYVVWEGVNTNVIEYLESLCGGS